MILLYKFTVQPVAKIFISVYDHWSRSRISIGTLRKKKTGIPEDVPRLNTHSSTRKKVRPRSFDPRTCLQLMRTLLRAANHF